jgi:hypothetical protein
MKMKCSHCGSPTESPFRCIGSKDFCSKACVIRAGFAAALKIEVTERKPRRKIIFQNAVRA